MLLKGLKEKGASSTNSETNRTINVTDIYKFCKKVHLLMLYLKVLILLIMWSSLLFHEKENVFVEYLFVTFAISIIKISLFLKNNCKIYLKI